MFDDKIIVCFYLTFIKGLTTTLIYDHIYNSYEIYNTNKI